jgi:SAM-dependent methyltransferase
VTKAYKRLSQVYDSGWSDFSRQYVDWINGLLAERGIVKGKILDLACGTGTLALELAQCGHIVQGIDISVEMIEKAKSKSARLPNISFDVQDMTRFEIDAQFNLVACTFDSINYIRNLNLVRRMLSRVGSVLDEAGIFIFDTNTKRLYQSHSNETVSRMLNGQTFYQHCRYDSIRNVAITTFSFSDGTLEIHRQWPYDYDDLSPILISSGLHIVQLFSWFDLIPYSPEAAKIFCVAEKSSETV